MHKQIGNNNAIVYGRDLDLNHFSHMTLYVTFNLLFSYPFFIFMLVILFCLDICFFLLSILDAYRTGRGRIVVRGKTDVELLDSKTKRAAIIINEATALFFH